VTLSAEPGDGGSRRICYVSGTRADFGLMRSTLQRIHDSDRLSLSVVAAGMHLDPRFGHTVDEIVAAGFPLAARIPVPSGPATGAAMARHIGIMTTAMVGAFLEARPDLVLLLGDRGEMLAGAIAALHLNIPIVHVGGGERTGTVDEPVRHAVSKLSHFHLTSTDRARERVIRMGEQPDRVVAVGAPGLDDIADMPIPTLEDVLRAFGLDPALPFALLLYHPVLQDAEEAGREVSDIMAALGRTDLQLVALMPNSDAGSDAIRAALEDNAERRAFALRTHLPRPEFLAAMAHADLMIGNSSAGIVEAAAYGTPVVNIGPRQTLRERNANVIDVPCDVEAILEGIHGGLSRGRVMDLNIYGDGRSGARIRDFLESVELGPEVLSKTFPD
jgi:GDP/UDP-N,N'-diacetylbacillosamine 2-epimerase (hydrolysing)